MSDPDELALVVKAIQSGLGGCVEWDGRVIDRIRQELFPFGLTPAMVRRALIAFVQRGGGIRQISETRAEWKGNRAFFYKAIVPMPALFKNGLFIEIVMSNADPENPEVVLVNAHEQK